MARSGRRPLQASSIHQSLPATPREPGFMPCGRGPAENARGPDENVRDAPENVRARPLPRQGGFTLVEMLVALVIAGILIGVATLSIGGFDRTLRYETERLAQLLSLAREEALVRGAPIRLETSEEGYRFAIRRDRRWLPVLDDRDLRERAWKQPTRTWVERADGRKAVEFGRDQVDVPFVLHVERGDERFAIASNGLGLFELR